jgi:hypothetical protein
LAAAASWLGPAESRLRLKLPAPQACPLDKIFTL